MRWLPANKDHTVGPIGVKFHTNCTLFFSVLRLDQLSDLCLAVNQFPESYTEDTYSKDGIDIAVLQSQPKKIFVFLCSFIWAYPLQSFVFRVCSFDFAYKSFAGAIIMLTAFCSHSRAGPSE